MGRVFLLGDAAHLTPPFIGQGLAAGIRDADNLSWKIAQVTSRRATPDLLATYQVERRPHARTLIRKAKLIGWAMTGGQGTAAVARRVLLSAAVRSARIRDRVGSTATPRLRGGALQRPSGSSRLPRALRVGGLIPNPLLCLPSGRQLRLDDVLNGATAMLTGRPPEPDLVASCLRQGITLVRITAEPVTPPGDEWVTAHLVPVRTTGLYPLTQDPTLTVLVRPDRVIAAVSTRYQPPGLPWDVT